MADLEYFIVCRSVSIDVETDELTFGNVIEDLSPDIFPTELPRAVAVSAWRISAEESADEFQVILRVLRPGEQPEEAADFPMNLATGRIRYRAMESILEIPLEQSGDLKFEVLLNGQHAATHIVTIHPAKTSS
jgi:hypothetical protein